MKQKKKIMHPVWICMKIVNLANGSQVKENCLDLKPGDASTFSHVIEKVFLHVTKTKHLSAICNSCPPDRSFPSWSLFTLNYSQPEWLKSSASANGEEFIRELLKSLEMA